MTFCQMAWALWRQGWEKWGWEGKARPRKTVPCVPIQEAVSFVF